MKENTQKRIEVAANLAIIITAFLLCLVLAQHLLSERESPTTPVAAANEPADRTNRRPRPQIVPGTKFSIDGVDWAKNGRTLLLLVSEKCHFCTESAPFYQRLARERGKTRLVAVLPQTILEGKIYLDQLKVIVDDIKQSSFSALGVRGTPTLILVDEDGTTINSWVGKLTPDRETEVLASLH